MKRGVILEIRKETITVLTTDGEFQTLARTNSEWKVGQEIRLAEKVRRTHRVSRSAWFSGIAVAAALLLVFVSAFIYSPFKDRNPIAYVSIDLDTNMELQVNEALEVIELTGHDESSADIIKMVDNWSFNDVGHVTVQLLFAAREQGYLDEDQRDVLISTALVDDDAHAHHLAHISLALDEVQETMNELPSLRVGPDSEPVDAIDTHDRLLIHQVHTERDVYEKAREKYLSPAKYTLYVHAVENGYEISLEDVQQYSVTQLWEQIPELEPLLLDNAAN